MADIATRTGALNIVPINAEEAGESTVSTPLGETMTVKTKTVLRYELTADPAVTVDMGGVANANIVVVKVTGGYCKVKLTTVDGDAVLRPDASGSVLYSTRAGPVTAMTIQREPAIPVVVKITLAEAT